VVMCVVGAYLFAGLSPFGEGELEGLTALSEGGVGAIPRQLVKGCVGWLQTICAQDYLFCLPIVRTVVTKLFPARMLHEEMFAGIASGWRAAILPCCTFAGILVMVVLAGVRRLRCRISQPATDAESASLRRQLAWSMAVWWVAQAFLALVTQPGSPEVWVFAVLPLGIGLTAGMFAGHRVSFSVQTGLLLCLLALHNYVGGHLINSHEGGDYYAVRGKWVLENMRSEDMVLTADTAGYVRYLAYLAPGRVVDLYQIHPTNAPALIGGVIEDGGHVFASEQVFFALEPMRNRFPERHDCILDVGRQLFPEFRRVTTSPAGDTYQYHGVSTPLDQH